MLWLTNTGRGLSVEQDGVGQDVKQWTYDITDWVDNSTENNLQYRGLFNGQEYVPQDTNGGSRQIRANIWLVWYVQN